jgi:hypothetical protein
MNLTELQKRFNSQVREKWTAPDEGSDEWNWNRDLLNKASQDWENTYLWPALYKEVNTFFSGATLSLPNDFKRYNGPLVIAVDGGNHEYIETNPDERTQYKGTDRYFYILGNKKDGLSMIVNPGTVASTNSVYYSYYSSANSLVSGDDQTEISDPNFLIEKAAGYYWRARDDSRFTLAERNADIAMAKMLEFEQSHGRPYDERIKTYEEARSDFRLGRD